MKKLMTISLVALAVAATGYFAPQSHAQEAPATVADVVANTLFSQSGDIYRNAGIDRQATLLLGLSFPDREAFSDTQSVDKIVKDAIRQRGSQPVRTNDLPNPFTSSLLTSPPNTAR
jgi:hypothetical protein